MVVFVVSMSSGSQRLGKTMHSLATDVSKKLRYPKYDYREVIITQMEEYNKHLIYIVEEIKKGNTTKLLSAAKYLYRKGTPKFARMMYYPKMLQDTFDWNYDDVKRFFDLHRDISEKFTQFLSLFQLKIAGGRIDWTPKPDILAAKVTTYKVKKRKIKEIITG